MSKELARKVKEAREKVEETQQQFAQRLGVPLPTLISWENDQRTPRGFALKALNDALDAILKGEK